MFEFFSGRGNKQNKFQLVKTFYKEIPVKIGLQIEGQEVFINRLYFIVVLCVDLCQLYLTLF